MNYKQLGILLIILAAGAIVFGALSSNKKAVPEETHVLNGSPTESGAFVYAEDASYYTIAAYYPATTTLPAEADAKARLAIEQALAERIAEFKRNGDFENLTEEDVRIQGLGPDRKYALVMEYKTYSAPGYVSYVYTVYEDTLGAHPNSYFLTLVFDESGAQTELAQVLANNPNGLEELSLVVSNQVVEEYRRRAGVEDGTDAIFAEGLSPTKDNYRNFYLDGEDLVILFPPYQVAAYAAGSFEARTPLADIVR